MDVVDFVGLYLTASPEVKKCVELLLSTVQMPKEDEFDKEVNEINRVIRMAVFVLAISDLRIRPNWKEGFEQIRRGEIKTYAESKPKRTTERAETV